MLCADGCMAALHQPVNYDFRIALVKPGGVWCFPKSLAVADIDVAPPMLGDAAIARLALANIDLALPQMFCLAGMTTYRALLDVLAIPYLGNRPFQMALTADKAKAKAVVSAAGVRVPRGELLAKGDKPTLLPPVVVKPNNSDNSDGVTFVQDPVGY